MTEWTNPLGVVWTVDAPASARRWSASWSVAFALAPRATAMILIAALVAPSAAAPTAFAQGRGADPVINLPANPGGQTTGDDNVAAGQPAPEEQADSSTPVPVAVPEEPAQVEPAPVATAEPTPAATAEPAPTATPEPTPAATSEPAPPAAAQPATTEPGAPAQAALAASASGTTDAAASAPTVSEATADVPDVAAVPTTDPAGSVPPPTSPAPAAAADPTVRAASPAPLRSVPDPRRLPRSGRATVRTAVSPPTAAPAPASSTAPPSAAASAAAGQQATSTPPRWSREYLVRQGDSLWTIAEQLLGSEASNARVAALVDALWQRNRERMGTDTPDALPSGITILVPKEQA